MITSTCALFLALVVGEQPQRDDIDLLYLHGSRPARLKIHLRIDDKPFGEAWESFLSELFAHLDHNGDGTLNKKEAESAPRAQGLRDFLRGTQVDAGRPQLAQMDSQTKDGKVTLEELRRYYRRFAVTALQINYIRVHGGSGNPLTSTLFRYLDADGDGKLAREEVERGSQRLRRLDLDDDEMIAAREIAPDFGRRAMRRPDPNERDDDSLTYLPEEAPFALVLPSEPESRVAEILLNRYDKDKDGKLSKEEVQLPDMSGTLPVEYELRARFQHRQILTPKLRELLDPFGKLAVLSMELSQVSPLEVLRSPPKARLQRGGQRSLLVLFNESEINLSSTSASTGRLEGLREGLVRQFKELGSEGVDEKRLAGPQFQALRALHAFADRNEDGKMTEAELQVALKLLEKGAMSCVVLTVLNRDQSLFEMIDTNQDGNLGERELRQAWEHLAPWDRDGDGKVSRDEIPWKYQIALSQGGQEDDPGAVYTGTRPLAKRGPVWFRKMDRNGDNDISLREFLGPREDFQRLDMDKDGLIDASEAERAESLQKKR